MQIPYRLIIDIAKPMRSNTILVKRGDRNSRVLQFVLLSNGQALDMSDILVATIKGTTPSKNSIFADAQIQEDEEGNKINVAEYTIMEETIAESGHYVFELSLLSSSEQYVTSFEFYVDVENLLYDENEGIGESDLSGYRSYMTRAMNAAKSAEETKNAFIASYGAANTLLNELNIEKGEYETYLNELQIRVDSGELNGMRGAQGENGTNGVVMEGMGILAFSIENDDLYCYYLGEDPPPLSINNDGMLVWTYTDPE